MASLGFLGFAAIFCKFVGKKKQRNNDGQVVKILQLVSS